MCSTMRDHGGVDEAGIREVFGEVFDQAVTFHGFANHMRDYDIYVQMVGDPRTGAPGEHRRLRSKHCVRAVVTSAITPRVWKESLSDALLTMHNDVAGGFVWGVRWQNLYPGMTLVPDSPEARQWSQQVGIPFHEAVIETNVHTISLLFSDLIVDPAEPGDNPYVVTAI
jgi:hypothetical protein